MPNLDQHRGDSSGHDVGFPPPFNLHAFPRVVLLDPTDFGLSHSDNLLIRRLLTLGLDMSDAAAVVGVEAQESMRDEGIVSLAQLTDRVSLSGVCEFFD